MVVAYRKKVTVSENDARVSKVKEDFYQNKGEESPSTRFMMASR